MSEGNDDSDRINQEDRNREADGIGVFGHNWTRGDPVIQHLTKPKI